MELVDARSARGCPQCGGLWVDEGVLEEMVLEMLPPGPLRRLQLEVMERSEAPVGCPSCHEQMHQTRIHDVVLDRCRKHGVWFDRAELGAALLRVGDPDRAQPLVESPRPGLPFNPPTNLPLLRFRIATPGKPVRDLELRRDIIKIGRMASAHVHVDDPRASRMHAVIECLPTEVTVIDLGSTDRTLVNGSPVTKHQLASGDRLLVGATTIEIAIIH